MARHSLSLVQGGQRGRADVSPLQGRPVHVVPLEERAPDDERSRGVCWRRAERPRRRVAERRIGCAAMRNRFGIRGRPVATEGFPRRLEMLSSLAKSGQILVRIPPSPRLLEWSKSK